MYRPAYPPVTDEQRALFLRKARAYVEKTFPQHKDKLTDDISIGETSRYGSELYGSIRLGEHPRALFLSLDLVNDEMSLGAPVEKLQEILDQHFA